MHASYILSIHRRADGEIRVRRGQKERDLQRAGFSSGRRRDYELADLQRLRFEAHALGIAPRLREIWRHSSVGRQRMFQFISRR